MRRLAPLMLMLGLFACASDPAPTRSHAPQSPPSSQPASVATPVPASDPPAACTPNVGARCAASKDCAQCADVTTRLGTGQVRLATAVDCVDQVCKKTGCPVDRCPAGQSCTGCVANLPCECR